MSEIKMISCDGCGAAAPAGYLRIMPSDGWFTMVFFDGCRYAHTEVCSAICLEAYAARLVDEANQTASGRAVARPQRPMSGMRYRGRRAQELRILAGLQRVDLAKIVGCTRDLIRAIENGEEQPSTEQVALIALALAVNSSELVVS